MDISFDKQAIVFVGQFNVAALDKYFFIKNDFFDEGEISSRSIFSEFQSMIWTDKLNLIIGVDKIQISPSDPTSDINSKSILDLAKKIASIEGLEFVAFGINFQLKIKDGDKPVEQLSREILFTNDIPVLKNYFNTDDVAIGMYLSKNVKEARLRLEIKPIIATTRKKEETVIKEDRFFLWAFNYHHAINKDSAVDLLIKYIDEFDFYKSESFEITSNCKR